MQTMLLARPARGPLRRLVAGFRERRGVFPSAGVNLPLPARTEQFIEFYLADPYSVRIDGGAPEPTPEAVVVGPQTYRKAEISFAGEVLTFTIHFRPTGFHRLFGLDMPALVNQAAPLRDVLGARGGGLHEAVLSASDFPSRAAAAEAWLYQRLDIAKSGAAVDMAAWTILRSGGSPRIADLAARLDLSERQFTRAFTARVGMGPKLFGRISRLHAVLKAHAAAPGRAWTELALDAGYFDQAHFVRDCRELAGAAPTALIRDTPTLPMLSTSDFSKTRTA